MTHEEIVEEIVEEFRREVRFVSPCCSSTLYFGGNHHIFCHGCYKEVQLNSVITELGNKLRKKIRMTLTTTAQRVREETIEDVLKGERLRIIEQLREEVRTEEKADWLRSEIERLNWMLKELDGEPLDDWNEDISWNQAIVSIITRYKEELKVLESK